MKNSPSSKTGILLAKLIFACLMVAAAAVQAQTQDYWQGGSADYNVAANWSLGVVPASGYAADNDTGTNNICYINAGDPNWTLNGIRDGINSAGAFVQNGATITLGSTESGWLRMGVTAGSSIGYYTINSNAVLNTSFGVTVGETGSGVLNIYGGTMNVGTEFIVNYNGAGGSSGTVNQTNGTVNCNTQAWIGQGTGGQNGVFNMSGGFFGCTNWFVLGRSGGTGVMNMTGGVLNAGGNGGYLDIGTGFQGSGTGTLNQSGGTINIVGNGILACPETQGGNGTYNLSGTGVLNCPTWLCIGRGGPGTLNMSGGMIIKNDTGGDHIDIAAGGSSSGSGTGTVNQTGGIITNTTTDVWLGEVANATWNFSGGTNYFNNLVIAEGSGVQSTMNAEGGFLLVNSIYSAQPVASFSTLNMNGSTIQASGNSSSFIYNVDSATIQPGGVTFDTQGYTVTIPQILSDGGGGSLIKIGSGMLTLSGANSYAGTTIVSNGVLSTTTASTGDGSYTTMDGTTLDVAVAGAGTSLAMQNLTLGNASGATLQIDLGSYGNPTVAPITVSGTLTANGTVTINVTDGLAATGQFQLISYASPGGSGTFKLGSISSGIVATLVNDTARNSIDLLVTSAGAPYWNGNVANGFWDINTTTNWLDLATGNPETFRNGEPVLFNDNATGTTTVDIAAAVQPGSVTVNNTVLPYTFTGSGSIGGTGGLVKGGSNILTIANTTGNTFTGPVAVNAGILSVASLANGGSASAIGASSASPTNLVLAGGTLSYTGPAAAINRGYEDADTNSAVDINAENNLSLSGTVTAAFGAGFVKAGPAQLAYANSGISTLSDALGYSVDQGTVLFNGTGTNNIAGTFLIGVAGSTNATVALTNNTTLNVLGGNVEVGNGSGSASTGAITQAGGTFNAGNGQIWIGQGAGGVGALTLTGGTFYADNWLAVGRDNGTGTLNISGNAVLVDNGGGGNMDIGTSGGIGGVAGTGTLNQTGGAITNTASEVWLGEGSSGEPASGTWNMSGGTANVGEVHVGVGGTGTSTLNVSGSASITESYLLLANYDTNTIGNVNVGSASQPGGTVTVNADMNVGGQGTGTLNFVTNGGGKLTVTGTLYLSRFTNVANGTVNLNAGGTLIAGYINNGWGFQNNFSSPLDNPNAFNFNGGTLRAYVGSENFIQPYVNAVVQSGGAIIDDGGYSITVLAGLVNGGGGGGLTKLGAGTLILNGVNTYTGMTVVSAGTLAVSSSGSIAGPVTVDSGATLAADAGSIQTTYINNTLTLNAGSTTAMQLTPASNDQIAGLTGVTYGGALVITNASGEQLTVGNVYKLFNCSVAGTGNFRSVTILPSGAGTFNPATGTLTIVASTAPVINSPVLVNGKLVVTGSGGTAGSAYALLSSTNVATPLADWITNTSGVFSATGTFSNAIPLTNVPAMFFKLQTP